MMYSAREADSLHWGEEQIGCRDASFQEISWFQEILQEMSWFQEILLCTKEYESVLFHKIFQAFREILTAVTGISEDGKVSLQEESFLLLQTPLTLPLHFWPLTIKLLRFEGDE